MAGINNKTKFISHWNGQDGGKEIIDDGVTGHIITQVATAQLTTAQKQFGSTSLFLDGNSDYLSIPDSVDWDIMGNIADDWTIDFWFRFNVIPTSTKPFFGQRESNTNNYRFITDSLDHTFNIASPGGAIDLRTPKVTDMNFHHMALVRKGEEWGLYLDGVQKDYDTNTFVTTIAGQLLIGTRDSSSGIGSGNAFFDGNIDEFRIQKSNAFNASPNVGNTDTITVPTFESIPDTDTKLLLHLNSHDISGDGGSNSYHIPTFIGTAQLDTAIKQFGSSSLFFDGNSDYISLPDSPDWDIMGNIADDWTIDFWFRFNVIPTSTKPFFGQRESNTNNYRFITDSENHTFNLIGSGGLIDLRTPKTTDSNFHHFAIIRKGTEWGMYLDGVQKDYDTNTFVTTIAGQLLIGTRDSSSGIGSGNAFLDGNIDEFRIQKSNIFSASPNIGLTDTITVFTQEYTVDPFPAPAQDEIRFNPFLGRQENVNPEKIITFDKFSGNHYKNYKKE